MRTSSVMSVMISIAICDLVSMFESTITLNIIQRMDPKDCIPPVSLLEFQIFQVLQSVRDDVIRCSTWLSVSLALIRYLVLKMAARGGSGRLSSFQLGFQVFGGILAVSSLFSTCYSFRTDIIQVGWWTPPEQWDPWDLLKIFWFDSSCHSDPRPIFESHASDLFRAHNGLILRIFMFANGIVSKIVPCVLFPILTGLLIVELRTAENNRNGVTTSQNKLAFRIRFRTSVFPALNEPPDWLSSCPSPFSSHYYHLESWRVFKLCIPMRASCELPQRASEVVIPSDTLAHTSNTSAIHS